MKHFCTTVKHGNAMIPEIVFNILLVFSVDSVIIADFFSNSGFSCMTFFVVEVRYLKFKTKGRYLKKEVLSSIVQD